MVDAVDGRPRGREIPFHDQPLVEHGLPLALQFLDGRIALGELPDKFIETQFQLRALATHAGQRLGKRVHACTLCFQRQCELMRRVARVTGFDPRQVAALGEAASQAVEFLPSGFVLTHLLDRLLQAGSRFACMGMAVAVGLRQG